MSQNTGYQSRLAARDLRTEKAVFRFWQVLATADKKRALWGEPPGPGRILKIGKTRCIEKVMKDPPP